MAQAMGGNGQLAGEIIANKYQPDVLSVSFLLILFFFRGFGYVGMIFSFYSCSGSIILTS